MERSGHRLDRRPGSIDIVDHHDPPAAETPEHVGMNGEGTGHVPRSGIARKPHLLARSPGTAHQSAIDGQPGNPADLGGQFPRLVVAAPAQARGMERHRHEKRLARPEFVPCPRHQPPAEARQLRPVAIFEPADQRARHFIVAHRRPRPPKGRWIGQRFG